MDYQTIEQDNSSSKKWYIIIAVVIIVLAFWYFYGNQIPSLTDTSPTAIEQTQIPPLSGGNTVADISADFNQTPDTSSLLDQSAAASAQAVQGF